MINYPLIKCTKAWIWISYLSKNTRWEFGNFSISGKGIPRLFYFQEGSLNFFIFKEGTHPILDSR